MIFCSVLSEIKSSRPVDKLQTTDASKMKYFSNSEAHYVQAVSQYNFWGVSDVTTSILRFSFARRVFEVYENILGPSWADTLCTEAQM